MSCLILTHLGLYNVEAVGGVENFSPWSLKVQTNESAHGYISLPLQNVQSGYVEGFRSHHAAGTAVGTWVRYSLLIDEDIYLHFMYSVPYSHDFHSNWLSIALCEKDNDECSALDAEKMYYNTYPFMAFLKYSRRFSVLSI